MLNFDPQKTLVTEILSFDGAELETIRNNQRSFTTAGTLTVLYFRDYHRFILALNDWKYVLFDQSPIIKASPSFAVPIIYNIPLNEGFYSLRLSKIPHLEAVKNLETIFSNITSFSVENDFAGLDKENMNPRRTFREHLYGEGSQWDSNVPDITELMPRTHLEGSESKLSGFGVMKKGIVKATDKIARGLITMQANNVNLTQIRDFNGLISSTADDVPAELLWRKDVEDLILHDAQFGHEQKEQHSIGDRLKEGIHDIRQRLSFKSPVQEDVFHSRQDESSLQPGFIDRFRDKLHLKTSAERNEIDDDSDKRTVTEVLHGIKENLAWKFNERFHHKHEGHTEEHHQDSMMDKIKRKLSHTPGAGPLEGSNLDPNKTRGMEILYFEGVELERTKNNVHSFQTVGTLRVFYFEDYSKFILFLGDWSYALLQDMSIVKTSLSYFDPIVYKLSTNDGSFTLRMTKVPYIQAIQNLETIFMKNTSYSTSDEAYEGGRPSISRTQLYGVEPESFEGSLSVKTNEMISEDERLGRIDVVKREILKTTDKIITGLTPNKAENVNLVRIRDYETLLNPTEDSDVRIKSKSREEIEKIIIDTQEMAHRMRETSPTDYESTERRSVVNSIKEGFEDFKTVLATTCKSQTTEKNYELIIDQDRRATRAAEEHREHPGVLHRLKEKLIPEGESSLAERIKGMIPHGTNRVGAEEPQGPGLIDRLKTRIPDMLHIHRDKTPVIGGQEQFTTIDNTYSRASGAIERQEIMRRDYNLVQRDAGVTKKSYGLDEIRGFTLDYSRQGGQEIGLENPNRNVFYAPIGSQGFGGIGQSYEPLYHYEG